MSGLPRRIALAAFAVLSLQFLASLGVQVALSVRIRTEVVQQLTRGLEHAGALRACTARPGPWTGPDDWWTLWPVATDGQVLGEAAPLATVMLPDDGTFVAVAIPDHAAAIYASPTADCGGLLMVRRARFPVMESNSAQLTALVIARLLLVLLAGLALVAVTAVPLVRRIRGLADAMRAVVIDDFQGTVSDGTDDELGEVATAFDAASTSARERLQRLQHQDALLRRAVADLAHDLRTPLATLQLTASSLPASTAATTIRAELSFIEGMTRNVEALLEGQEGDIAPLTVDRLLERVLHRFAPVARDRQLVFDLALPDEALRVTASEVALERAVSNLVHNALRFAQQHVVLVLFAVDDDVRIEVRDDGPGLGDLSDRAAERGVRGDGATHQGSGLGLAIAEATVRRHGGRLELGQGEDGGALIALVLPRSPTSS